MPITIRRTEGSTVSDYPLPAASLPIELYFKLVFESPKAASDWCDKAVERVSRVNLDYSIVGLQRLVIWGPPAPEPGWVSGGHGNVFVSELTVRLLRALGDVRVPDAEPVALSGLDYDLKMYTGAEADQRAFRKIRSR